MPPRVFLLLCLIVTGTGCAPSFSPLYRDFDVSPDLTDRAVAESQEAQEGSAAAEVRGATERDDETQNNEVYERIRTALAAAGWEEGPQAAPNVVSTEPRTLSDWGLYRVLVSLDVVPIGDRHVRVLFHPVRRYFTGGRSKIPYLNSGLRQALLPALNEAFEAQGLYPIGTPRERDEEEVEGT